MSYGAKVRVESFKVNFLRRNVYIVLLLSAFASYNTLDFSIKNIALAKSLGVIQLPASISALVGPLLDYLFPVYVILLGFAILFGFSKRLITLIICFLTYVFNSVTIPTMDGGNNLLFIVNIYLLIIDERKSKSFLKAELLNIFQKMCFFQISIMYFTSSIYKLQTESWVSGEALFNTLLSLEYSTPFFANIIWNTPLFLMIAANYSIIFFQLTFPVGVLCKRTKALYIIYGILMHFGIGLVIGLPTFGLSVIACYTVFMSNKNLLWILKKKRILFRRNKFFALVGA